MVMSFIGTCPIDGLALVTLEGDFKRNTAEDRASHLHIPFAGNVSCLNAHNWNIHGELLMEPR